MTTDLNKMGSDELATIVEQYPWFAAARVELCRRTAGNDPTRYAEVAAYIGDLSLLYEQSRRNNIPDLSDKEVRTAIKETPRKVVRAAGGDFFSQDEYDGVKNADDNVIASIARAARDSAPGTKTEPAGSAVSFCTEALAEIYAEQGYFDQAKHIYSQLILRYPEKSAYFAVLIDKLNKIEKDNTL